MEFTNEQLDKWRYFTTETSKLPDGRSSNQIIADGDLTQSDVDFILENYLEMKKCYLRRLQIREDKRIQNIISKNK